MRTPKGASHAAGPARRWWRPAGVPELAAGGGLLLFVLVQQPLALPALALAVGGFLSLGLRLYLDDRPGTRETVPSAGADALIGMAAEAATDVVVPLPVHAPGFIEANDGDRRRLVRVQRGDTVH